MNLNETKFGEWPRDRDTQMSHQRSRSDATISTTSSDDSCTTIDDIYSSNARTILASSHATLNLEGSAREHVGKLLQSRERWIATPTAIDGGIDTGRVLMAMLDYSRMCGGDHSVRYTASAILACNEVTHDLVDLANTWVRYLLWPCMHLS
jgi:hypothetical protein